MTAATETPLAAFSRNPVVEERLEGLLSGMTSGWPRRGCRLLAVAVGRADLLEMLWQAGFDLTVQEKDPDILDEIRETLKNRAAYFLGSPDHLPVDDNAFDHAVILTGAGEPAPALMEEIHRVVCRGALFVFASSWSLAALECRIRAGFRSPAPGFASPRALRREARRVFGAARRTWGSILPAPARTWKPGFPYEHLNAPLLPLPLGAISCLRLDMGPPRTGTPLVVRAADPVVE